jgi:glycosyltransferase involved in cell wall biosynthesis
VTVALAAELAARDDVEVRLFAPVPARGADRVADLLTETRVEGKAAVTAIAAARRRIVDWQPHVVHAQDRRSGLVCAALRRPVVHTYHRLPDDVPARWIVDGTGPAPSRYIRAVLKADAAVARSMDRTVVVAPSMADFLTQRLRVPPRRVVHIDNGLPHPPARVVTGPVRRLLFVGLLVQRKAVHLLLEALADPRLPGDLTLRVAGDGPEAGALRRQSAVLGLEARVEFLGFRPDVGDLMADSDALVVPSLLEQQPLVVIEALGAGLPCLATDVGGVADQLGDDGVVVAPGSAPALVDGLLTLLDADTEKLSLRAAERARVRFSVQACAERHLALYRSL